MEPQRPLTAIERILQSGDPLAEGAHRCEEAPEGDRALAYVPKEHVTGVEPMISVDVPVGDGKKGFFKLFRDHPTNYVGDDKRTIAELDDAAVLKELGL